MKQLFTAPHIPNHKKKCSVKQNINGIQNLVSSYFSVKYPSKYQYRAEYLKKFAICYD